ncbi:HEPN domain-containing protein [Candidatus Pacearchaeota archaeon]|nr:HEPN domain-containing protein [Candidatus Pacearchaeota archaeon]
MQSKNKLDECFKEGERGGERHKGLKKIDISRELINKHLAKATHNLNAIIEFKNIGYSDWSASAAFYALYHCLLALLIKFGYQSRNQTCTFAFIEGLINKGKISLKLEELKEIFDKDITENLAHSEKILDIRENMQYSFKTSMEKEEFNKLLERTKLLFDKIRKEIEKEDK